MSVTRRAFLSTALPLLASCAMPPESELSYTIEPLHDIVKETLSYIREKDYSGAEKYLHKFVRVTEESERPALDHLLALVYAANNQLQSSGVKFRHEIQSFEKDSSVLDSIRDAIPVELYQLDMYTRGKRQLGAFISLKPSELYPTYSFLCLVERDYKGAEWAAKGSVAYHPFLRRQNLASKVHECIDRAFKRKSAKDAQGLMDVHDALLDESNERPRHVLAVQFDPNHQCGCLCSCRGVLH